MTLPARGRATIRAPLAQLNDDAGTCHATLLHMRVTKRDGRLEAVQFDKITQRLLTLCDPVGSQSRALDVDVTRVAAQVCAAVHDGISTARLDELAADIAAGLSTEHPDYGHLAARILVSNLQKNTSESFAETCDKMRALLSDDFLRVVEQHGPLLQAMLVFDRDYDYDFFGFKTIEKLYLTRVDGVVVERPQHMWLRVALALWPDDLARAQETYEYMSTGRFTHASPTLFNAGLKRQQLKSCYLTGIEEDSIDGIFDAVTKCAKISKYGGGIGIHVSGVRGKGAPIKGTNGRSDGLVPMLRVLNAVAGYVNQVQCFHRNLMRALSISSCSHCRRYRGCAHRCCRRRKRSPARFTASFRDHCFLSLASRRGARRWGCRWRTLPVSGSMPRLARCCRTARSPSRWPSLLASTTNRLNCSRSAGCSPVMYTRMAASSRAFCSRYPL